MLEFENTELSVRRQCALLSIQRSGAYYEPVETTPEELELMRCIDEQYLKTPFYGSRRMTETLNRLGHEVNRKRIQRLMRIMGLEGLAPGPSTSRPHPEHEKYPYLLGNVEICKANQAWAADISYIPMAHGFLYLVAIMDWFSRKVLSWRLSNTMEAEFCAAALTEALDRYGVPEISNTDQGSQFTADEYLKPLKNNGVKISMDGKGRFRDNIFVERLWRSLKYEEVYLKSYDHPAQAKEGIGSWFRFYNGERPHQSLDYRTPDAVYHDSTRFAA